MEYVIDEKPIPEHTVKELMGFFSTDERPVTPSEFMAFWKPLSDEERSYYKTAPLT